MKSETRTISWRELTGNKFSKALHPAMFSEHGYIHMQSIRRTGDPYPAVFEVSYDREYAVEFVSRKCIKPMSFLGKEEALKCLNEAWDLYEKNSLHSHFVNDPVD